MDGSAEETKVEWREWGEEAFDVAARTGKPVLLALVTRWSAECREMDVTTYAEPRIAASVNDGFVPVRVDADRQPRVRERYNMGGFPSTVFLTPSGEILTGATFLGIDGFRGILDSVRKTWDGKGDAAGSVPRALREDPPGGSVDERVEEHMVEQLLATYDDEFGGWGTDVKFPLPRTVEFALVRARDQATRTLEAIRTHLLDTYDGGFYRFSRNRNWRGARREKLADENAAIVRAFAHGYRYTGEEAYRGAARRGVEYLTTTLWTGDGVGASQGGDEEYFRLEPAEREDADPPELDPTVFADRNGLAVDALLSFFAYTDDDTARRYARGAREHVCETLVDGDGRATHYRDGDEVGERGLLVDQARLLTGLTTSWSVLGEPGPVRAVADWTLDHLQADGGAFRDGPAEGAGLLDRPLFPLDTTVELADALLDLALLTGDDRYREAAHEAIAAFAGAAERMGVEVAHYATVAARLREPQVIEVGTPPGTDLHRSALRLADHETVVVPRLADDGELDPNSQRDLPDGEARVVVDGRETDRADSPGSLETVLTGGE
ncbi:thioredoxin domain-containing protein [Halobacteriales archaeon QH_2_65_14]|nr:MAG: thioredoxin domain-containing protein [Halobacteriales archaeon QH_2_65_14]